MHLEFNLEPGIRLDAAIAAIYPDLFSRSHAQKIIHEGQIRVNNEICQKPSFKSKNLIPVSIDYFPPAEYQLQANFESRVPVIFQDKYLAVIYKPAGMTVHPGAGTKDDTLVHVLLSQMDHLSEGSGDNRPGIVHRLDRETEGLMVIAKDNHTHFELARLFSDRKITKEYYAAVWGMAPESGTVEGFIGRHPVNRKKMLFDYTKLNETYKDSSMEFTTIQHSVTFSLLKIILHTGRTHQIRASMSKLDHPVVGDEVYSRYHRRLEKTLFPREIKEKILGSGLYLMAYRLSFIHPTTRENLNFELPLPFRFNYLLSI